jgi:hypothetical protein
MVQRLWLYQILRFIHPCGSSRASVFWHKRQTANALLVRLLTQNHSNHLRLFFQQFAVICVSARLVSGLLNQVGQVMELSGKLRDGAQRVTTGKRIP